MNFLNGFKTIIGALGLAVTVVAPSVAPEVIAGVGSHAVGIAEGVFGLLTVIGVIHKVEKSK